MLKKDDPTKPQGFDAIIDGASADPVTYMRLCRPGGYLVTYGGTAGALQKVNMTQMFLRHDEYRGSTMGSDREFADMMDFVKKHSLKPVVSNVYKGLENGEDAFEAMRLGKQFGKLVVEIRSPPSKL
jgi:D-arabinose 1-dehydrogenase-like Zn-dependent alcohol dehydrogenase